MRTLSLPELAGVAGGVAASLAAAGAIASAAPDFGPAVNTTCNYSQVVAAINAQSPSAAEKFNTTPIAQTFLRTFLNSPPADRENMLEQAAGIPAVQQYVSLLMPVASTCNNY